MIDAGVYDEPWIIVATLVAPVIAWWLWEMARAWREGREIRRIQRQSRGDGMP